MVQLKLAEWLAGCCHLDRRELPLSSLAIIRASDRLDGKQVPWPAAPAGLARTGACSLHCGCNELLRTLKRQLAVSVLEFIRSGADPAERMIGSLIECEHDFINCDHPEFIGGRGAIRAVMQDRALRATQGAARAK
eukprot:scaffold176237_cov18-Tisochrysis_lutea.AAC.4